VVAGPRGPDLLTAGAGRSDRSAQVRTVLVRILVLNLVVAAAKIGFGYASGAVSILSDGFHSLADTSSNVVALAGVRAAALPPDRDHPYGHRKYETMAAAAIMALLLVVTVEVLRTAIDSLRGGSRIEVGPAAFGVMLVTLAVNVAVMLFERREGRRLSSEVLIADSRHTSADVLTSLAVIAALAGVSAGYPILDPLAGLVVAGFIAHAGYQIARDAERILSDRIVVQEDAVRNIVMQVPHVLGCHQIRSRGSADHVFLDLHIWMSANTSLDEAHHISHVVKDRLMHSMPQIADAVIHIEPPPR
jgi:cation diffusion facilitator family transporter